MLSKGFLATTSVYTCYAHKKKHIEKYLQAVDDTFGFIKKSIKEGNPDKYLKGPVCHSGFKRIS